jgi:hypothetical protein
MTTAERDKLLLEKRREATREKLMQAPKTAGAVGLGLMKNLAQVTQLGYKTEGSMLKAQCKRLAKRVHVIGNTVFRFDAEGICRVVDQGFNASDFDMLCKQHGVVRLDTETELPVGVAPPAPAAVEAPKQIEAPKASAPVADASWEAGPPDLVVPPPAEDDSAVVVDDSKKASRRKPAKE